MNTLRRFSSLLVAACAVAGLAASSAQASPTAQAGLYSRTCRSFTARSGFPSVTNIVEQTGNVKCIVIRGLLDYASRGVVNHGDTDLKTQKLVNTDTGVVWTVRFRWGHNRYHDTVVRVYAHSADGAVITAVYGS